MIKDKVFFIKRRPGSIISASLLLIILLFLGVRVGGDEGQQVLSFAVANRVIVVDAGHGGIDPGAIGKTGVEKDVTLAIAKKLAYQLSQAGALVVNLRESDHDLAGDEFIGSLRERKRQDLANRVDRAHKAQAELYISIHTNSVLDTQWSGPQTFYNSKDEAGKKAASAIQEELSRLTGNTKRKAKSASYYVLDKTKMPAVIVEVGFLSNPREGKLLNTDKYQSQVAYAIFTGIVKSQMPEASTGEKNIEANKPGKGEKPSD